MSEYNLGIVESPEANVMIQMITKGFYDRSRIGLWLFEVIGREYDDMAVWVRTLRDEALPQTCTWSISIWEFVYGFEPDDSLTLEYRRARILAKKYGRPPINPANIEAALSELTRCPVYITENVSPYTFLVEIDESAIWSGAGVHDYTAALKLLKRIKPSHLSFKYAVRITLTYEVTDYSVAVTDETLREFYNEETEVLTGMTDWNGGAVSEYWATNYDSEEGDEDE